MKKLGFILIILISAALLTACNPLERKTKAGLQVITADEPVSIFLNDQYLDKSPYINKSLQEGEYVLRLEPDNKNLTTYETPIQLSKGLLTVVTWRPGDSPETSGGVIYELEPINNKKNAEVSFISIPDNTIIQFDNREKQFSPLIIDKLQPGHHEFEASLPSYETQKHTINLVKGHRLNISIKLAKNLNSTQNPLASPVPTDIINEETATNSANASPSAALSREDFLTNTASDSTESLTGNRVRILTTNYYVDSKEVLRVRDEPSASGKELGFAQVNKEYLYLDEQKNGWYKINFQGQVGWISGKYSQLILE